MSWTTTHPPSSTTEPTFQQTAIVHYSYDITLPPEHPGLGRTRFICISDTHSHVFPIPPGDVLLHASDLSRHGTLKDLEVTLDWMKALSHPAKLYATFPF